MLRASVVGAFGVVFAGAWGGVAHAATLRVPGQYPTIQAAVDAAAPGDRVLVSRGRYCGATLTKPVVLEGRGRPRIVGCVTSPEVTPGLRAGFLLPGSKGSSAASGSQVRGFVFDGRGVSSTNLEPLAFGVLGRFASDVVVERNRFLGTVQAVTNTGGDRWLIRRNRVTELTLLDCTVRHCTGGDGVVIQLARGGLAAAGGDAAAQNRPEHNVVVDNHVEGTAPDGFAAFSMVGVLVLSGDHTSVLSNRLVLRDNPRADAVGQGVVISNTCCGLSTSFLPGSRFTMVAFNDARRSEAGVVVEGAGGANTLGLLLHRNRGSVTQEGTELVAKALRVIAPVRAQPTQ